MCTHTRTTHQRDILKLYYNSDLLPPVSVTVCSLLPAKIFFVVVFFFWLVLKSVFLQKCSAVSRFMELDMSNDARPANVYTNKVA